MWPRFIRPLHKLSSLEVMSETTRNLVISVLFKPDWCWHCINRLFSPLGWHDSHASLKANFLYLPCHIILSQPCPFPYNIHRLHCTYNFNLLSCTFVKCKFPNLPNTTYMPFKCYVMQLEVGIYGSSQIRVTKVHGPTLFALQGGRGAKLAEQVLRNTWMAPNRHFLP